jgi:hypothetical protein
LCDTKKSSSANAYWTLNQLSWLGRRFLKITFSQQEDDPIVDVDEIRELLDEDIKEAGNE